MGKKLKLKELLKTEEKKRLEPKKSELKKLKLKELLKTEEKKRIEPKKLELKKLELKKPKPKKPDLLKPEPQKPWKEEELKPRKEEWLWKPKPKAKDKLEARRLENAMKRIRTAEAKDAAFREE